MDQNKKPNLVLLCGYSRAGKDTFANGMEIGNRDYLTHLLAAPLKTIGNNIINRLNLGDYVDKDTGYRVCFWDEKFKSKHRNVLVTLARFARSLDSDVFVNRLIEQIDTISTSGKHVVITDWRYLNEYKRIKSELTAYNVVTVWIETIGIFAANEEEALSIAEIRKEMTWDYEFYFRQNDPKSVQDMGTDFVKNILIS
jgi:hypothetical protein